MIIPCNAIQRSVPCSKAAVYEAEVTCSNGHARLVMDCEVHFRLLHAGTLNCTICKITSGGAVRARLQLLSWAYLKAAASA